MQFLKTLEKYLLRGKGNCRHCLWLPYSVCGWFAKCYYLFLPTDGSSCQSGPTPLFICLVSVKDTNKYLKMFYSILYCRSQWKWRYLPCSLIAVQQIKEYMNPNQCVCVIKKQIFTQGKIRQNECLPAMVLFTYWSHMCCWEHVWLCVCEGGQTSILVSSVKKHATWKHGQQYVGIVYL